MYSEFLGVLIAPSQHALVGVDVVDLMKALCTLRYPWRNPTTLNCTGRFGGGQIGIEVLLPFSTARKQREDKSNYGEFLRPTHLSFLPAENFWTWTSRSGMPA